MNAKEARGLTEAAPDAVVVREVVDAILFIVAEEAENGLVTAVIPPEDHADIVDSQKVLHAVIGTLRGLGYDVRMIADDGRGECRFEPPFTEDRLNSLSMIINW